MFTRELSFLLARICFFGGSAHRPLQARERSRRRLGRAITRQYMRLSNNRTRHLHPT
jgi:hypothetical protein